MPEIKIYQVSYSKVKQALIADSFDLKGFHDDFLLEGKYINDWPSDAIIYVTGRNPPDNLFCPLKPWFVVSKRVKNVLEENGINGVQLLPVKIVHKSGIELPGYWILNLQDVIAGLDFERTTWLTPEKWNVEYPQLDMVKITLKKEAVLNKDIFRIIERKSLVFISKRVKNLLDMNHATLGFYFKPLKLTE